MEAKIQISLVLFLFSVVHSVTLPSDLAVLDQFRKGLDNGELLNWDGNDPCGTSATSGQQIFCSGDRVTQIQVKGLNLKGPLPNNFNQLSMLQNLGLQHNSFSGKLPSFSGLSELKYAYLDNNNFDSIPADFFNGLVNLEVLALDSNPINATTGWSLPSDLSGSAQLRNLTLSSCHLAGPLPEFLGNMSSLSVLKLSANRLSGEIPASFSGSPLNMLLLNDQTGGGMSGSIDVVSSMVSLTTLDLQGNHFSGKIPDNIGNLGSLEDLNLNRNDFVGLVPVSLANMGLDNLDLSNNNLMGPIPKFKAVKVTYNQNPFCSPNGAPCSSDVMALLDFLDGLNYPLRLVESWSGNDPCQGSWMGVGCDSEGKIITINLPKFNLSGTLSPSIANLDSLSQILLQSNNISGPIPSNWTGLMNLTILNLSDNDISPPLPKNFGHNVKVSVEGNPLVASNSFVNSALPNNLVPSSSPSMPSTGTGSNSTGPRNSSINRSKSSKLLAIVAPVACFVLLLCLVVPFMICICKKKRKDRSPAPLSSVVIHPRESSDSNNAVKIVVANDMNRTGSSLIPSGTTSIHGSGSHVIEAGNLVISVQILRDVTKDFASENELGRGGFGVVYKGELDDGTKIAVKRMESGVLNRKALDEFQSEIAVLSKVRHRHLVSLLGYSVEGNERILVYEYMPQGALSRHLFHWKKFQIEPLSWKKRLNIALDVARGMEYLHTLAHQSFIHRDLKSSNILLGDDFRAKVSDFGLVKLAPDGEKSVVTRLAGTFGYFAPEYAVMGKITTKTDVFSFGVVLMELLTGMMALDEDRSEESQYLVSWFWKIKSSPETLMAAIDPTIKEIDDDDKLQSISIISELAGHCTAREPNQRPEMGHAVNVLGSLVEKWKPLDDEEEDYCGIDYSLPLKEMVKDWQDAEGTDVSFMDLDDSKGSIPSRPTGFADSFTSSDGR